MRRSFFPPRPAPRRRLAALALPLGLLALAGCGNYSPEDAAFLRAAPRPIDIALQPPGAEVDDEAAAGTSQVQQALSPCSEAPLRCQAQQTARTFNALTGGLLEIIDNVINEVPPGRRLPRGRVWGPIFVAESNITFRLQLNRLEGEVDADHDYEYCLHLVGGRTEWRLNDPVTCETEVDPETGLTRVIHGGLTPGEVDDELVASGAGRMIFDGNALAEVTGDEDFELQARLDIDYNHFGGSETVSIDFSEVADVEDGPFTVAEYDYVRLQGGGGDFAFQVNADLNPEQPGPGGDPVLETYEIKAQWDASKAGAARAAVYGGNLRDIPGAPDRLIVSECWDGSLDTVYFRHPDPENAEVGEETDCLVPLPEPPA